MGLASFLNRTRTPRLDMRRMIPAASARTGDDLWNEEILPVWHGVAHVTRVDLPRVSVETVAKLLNAAPQERTEMRDVATKPAFSQGF